MGNAEIGQIGHFWMGTMYSQSIQEATPMTPILNPESNAPFSYANDSASRFFARQQTRAGAISVSQNTDVTLTTDEGDTVTINLAAFMETKAGIYQRTLDQGDRQSFSQTTVFESSRHQEMAIEVNGELNEDEMEDVRAALQTIGTMIDDFLDGDFKAMIADTSVLAELDTISSLEASFSYERQTMAATEETVVIGDTARHKGRFPSGRLQALMGRIDNLAEDLAEMVRSFGGRQDRLAASVAALLNDRRDEKAGDPAMDRLTGQVLQTTRSAFVQKMEMARVAGGFDLTLSA